MPLTIRLVLLVLAMLCFALASWGVASKINLEPLGLLLLTLAFVLA